MVMNNLHNIKPLSAMMSTRTKIQPISCRCYSTAVSWEKVWIYEDHSMIYLIFYIDQVVVWMNPKKYGKTIRRKNYLKNYMPTTHNVKRDLGYMSRKTKITRKEQKEYTRKEDQIQLSHLLDLNTNTKIFRHHKYWGILIQSTWS